VRTLRGRLTVLYGALYFLTGLLTIGATYFFTVRAVNAKFKVSFVPPEPSSTDQRFFGVQDDIQRELAAHRQEILSQLLQFSILAVVVLGVLTVAIGYLIAGRMLRPLRTVTATARRLSESNLHERISLAGPADEVKDLADTFDGMLDRLHRAFESQRRFIANASHELRTPIAMARTSIEVVLARPGTPPETAALGHKLLIANDRQIRLIDGLLTLARSERDLRTRVPVDVRALVRHALAQLETDATKAGVTLEPALLPGTTMGDPVLLERAVVNLVDNAIKYNHQPGAVWIRTASHNDHPSVTVENTGAPVPPGDLETMFEPFRRPRGSRVRSRHGTGLGLSIVRAVMHAHGGTVETAARPEGGLIVTLRLPPTPKDET
jgi:signal transduction histidine kinase